MRSRFPLFASIIAGLLAALALTCFRARDRGSLQIVPERAATGQALPPIAIDARRAPPPNAKERRADRDDLVARKRLGRLKDQFQDPTAKPNELLLRFDDPAAYRRFLGRADQAKWRILGKLDPLSAVRIGFDSLADLEADLANYPEDYADVGGNFLVYPPEPPPAEERARGRYVPIGDGLLEFLGVTGDTSQWGHGVTIAVLDSGVAADATFGGGRLSYADAGYGTKIVAGDGHGTAVAALAAGAASDAMGVAPSAQILSVRVTGDDGLSDSFTLARGVLAAADQGARVINISLGSYQDSALLNRAIDYAMQLGAVVVASAGNDQAAQLTWPAANPRVISVGAVDALEQQVAFSNSGDELKITAPGYGVDSAWLNGQRVSIDGTSVSAPIVAGSIAATMSQNPGMTADQAWQIVRRYSSDGGSAGVDPNYGYGVVNLGWVMNRNSFNRIDTAVSSHYLNRSAGQMEFLVQNRSGRSVAGLELNITVDGDLRKFSVPALSAGEVFVARTAIDVARLQNSGRIDYRTTLFNPPGLLDVVPSNNSRGNTVWIARPQ